MNTFMKEYSTISNNPILAFLEKTIIVTILSTVLIFIASWGLGHIVWILGMTDDPTVLTSILLNLLFNN